MEKFNNINTEPNVNSNPVEQDNNPEHLKPDPFKVEKDLGKVALYRVMNLDYHPDAKKNDETGEYEYIVNNQQYPEQGDFAYNSDGVGRAIDRAYPRQLHNVYEMSANEDDVVEPNPEDNPGVVFVKNGSRVTARKVPQQQIDDYIN